MRVALASALDFVFPRGCLSCRDWMPEAAARRSPWLCPGCRSRLRAASWPRCDRCHRPIGSGRAPSDGRCVDCRWWPEALIRARSAWLLVPPATDLVHALKYEGWRELADSMSEAVAVAARNSGADLVVSMPTTSQRERVRGYNQARLLGVRVARLLALPHVDALRRPGGGISQTSLDPTRRRANVRGVFEADGTVSLEGCSVVLVDDVLTTGATAAEAAMTLSDAGAREVTLVTFARALPEAISRLS